MPRCKFGIEGLEFANDEDRARFNNYFRQTGNIDEALRIWLENEYEVITDRHARGWEPRIRSIPEEGSELLSLPEQRPLESYLRTRIVPGFSPSQQKAMVNSLRWVLTQIGLEQTTRGEAFKRTLAIIKRFRSEALEEGKTFVVGEWDKVISNWPTFVTLTFDSLHVLGYETSDVINEDDYKTEEGEEVIEGEESNFEKTRYEDDAYFYQNTRDKAPARLKNTLSLIVDVEPEFAEGRIPVARMSYVGTPTYVNFDTIWSQLKSLLSDREGDFDEYLIFLKSQPNALYTVIANKLESLSYEEQSEFVAMMNQTRIRMSLLLLTPVYYNGKVVSYRTHPIRSDRLSHIDTMIASWIENQKNSPLTTFTSGEMRINDSQVRGIRERYVSAIREAKNQGGLRAPWFVEQFGKMLQDIGIALPEQALKDLPNNAGRIGNSSWASFVSMEREMSFARQALDSFERTDEEGGRFELNNPLIGLRKKGYIRKLAAYTTEYSQILYPDSFRNIESRTVNAYQPHNHLSISVRKFKEDPNYRFLITSTSFSRDSFWAELIEKDPQFADLLEVDYLDGTKLRNARRGQKRDTMSSIDQHLLALGLFQGPQQWKTLAGQRHAIFMAPTLGDKSRTPIFSFFKRGVDVAADEGYVTSLAVETVNDILRVALSEATRIYRFQNTVKDQLKEDGLLEQYAKGAEFFHLLPYLNEDNLKKLNKEGLITKAELNKIWSNGKLILNAEAASEIEHGFTAEKGVLRKVISYETIGQINGLIDLFKEQGLIRTEGGKTTAFMDPWYMRNIIQKDTTEDRIAAAVADYFVNYIYFNAEYARLFGGDPAHTWKDPDLSATKENNQKRHSGHITPINLGRWRRGESYLKVTIGDRLVDSKEAKLYKEELGFEAFTRINSTDSQEFTTVEEEIDFLNAYGRIPKNLYDRLKRKINANRGGSYIISEADLNALKKALFKPEKPIAFSTQIYAQYDTIVRTYTKSSSIPLIPQLIKGTELDKLRKAMENQHIARAAHESADKMGAVKITTIYTDDGRIRDDIVFESAQTLLRSEMGMQQEIPIKKFDILTVSQLDSLLFIGLRDAKDFEFMGKKDWSGRQLESIKERVRSELFYRGQRRLLTRLGAHEFEGLYSFNDLSFVRDSLVAEAGRRNWPVTDLERLQLTEDGTQFIVPLGFSLSEQQIQSLLFSMIKREITNQLMPGRAYVQVSSAGWIGENMSGVTFVEGYDPNEGLRSLRKDADGNNLPAQIIVPFHFLHPTGRRLKLSDYASESGKLDTDRISPEVLRLIGIRIPNQGPSSQLPFEIVGFFDPRLLDAGAIVPDEIVRQMGTDFDFDILYTYLTQYVVEPGGAIRKLQPTYESRKIPVKQKKLVEGRPEPFKWARTVPEGEESYEVSSAGDRRFSALYARLADGRTIEEAYQIGIKGYKTVKLGKGKPPKDDSVDLYTEYKKLWDQWAIENSALIEDLRAKAVGKVLTDKFAATDVSQARALAEILNETEVDFTKKRLIKDDISIIQSAVSDLGNNLDPTVNQEATLNSLEILGDITRDSDNSKFKDIRELVGQIQHLSFDLLGDGPEAEALSGVSIEPTDKDVINSKLKEAQRISKEAGRSFDIEVVRKSLTPVGDSLDEIHRSQIVLFFNQLKSITDTLKKIDFDVAIEETKVIKEIKGPPTSVTRVISGGQKGADRGGIEGAKSAGIETGGLAPKDFRTEDGDDPSLADFGLTQDKTRDFKPRTLVNVKNSDATVIFGNVNSAGSRVTANAAKDLGKPLLVLPGKNVDADISDLVEFLNEHNVKILNVAGNRQSRNKGLQERVSKIIQRALTEGVPEQTELFDEKVSTEIEEGGEDRAELGLGEQDVAAEETVEATTEELKQAYMDIIWSVLTHKDAIPRVMNPLDISDLKLEKEIIQKAMGEERRITSPLYIDGQIDDYIKQIAGKSLISIFSLASTLNSMIEDHNLRLVRQDGELLKIPFYTNAGERLELTHLSGTGTSQYDGQRRTKQQNISIKQNAALDNGVDNILGALNLNLLTAGPSVILSMLQDANNNGLDVSYDRMFVQESIRMFVHQFQYNRGALSTEYYRNVKQNSLDQVEQKLKDRYDEAHKDDPNYKPITEEDLVRVKHSPNYYLNLLKRERTESSSRNYIVGQLAVLRRFRLLDKVADRLTTVREGSMESIRNGPSQDLISAQYYLQRTDELSNEILIAGAGDLVGKFNAYNQFVEATTALGHSIMTNSQLAVNLLGQLFHYNSNAFHDSVIQIEKIIRRPMTQNEKREMWKGMRSYIYADSAGPWSNVQNIREELLMGDFVERVKQAKDTEEGKKNFLLDRLEVFQSGNTDEASTIRFFGSKTERLDSDEITNGFEELLLSADLSLRRLGRDIGNWSILTGGIQDAYSFIKYISTGYLEYIGFNEHLRSYDISTLNSGDFVKQHFQHIPMFAPEISRNETKARKGIIPANFLWDPEVDMARLQTIDEDGEVTYPQFVSLLHTQTGQHILYENRGLLADGTYHFARISVKGGKGWTEYDPSTTESVVPINRPTYNTRRGIENIPGTTLYSLPTPTDYKSRTYITYHREGLTSKELMAHVVGKLKYKHHRSLGYFLLGAQDYLHPNYTLSLNPYSKGGRYNYVTGETRINTYTTPEFFESTFIHEHVHALTSGLINRYEASSYQRIDPLSERIDRELPANVEETIRRLEDDFKGVRRRVIYDNADNFLNYRNLLIKIKNKDTESITDAERVLYPFISLHEYVTGVLTDSGFQILLNNIEADGEVSVLERVKQFIQKILETLANHLGFDINPNSILVKSLTDVLHLIALQGPNTYLDERLSELNKGILQTIPFSYRENSYNVNVLYTQNEKIPVSVEGHIGTDLEFEILNEYRKENRIYDYEKDVNLEEELVEVYSASIDNKYELFPGVYANKAQREAIDKMETFLKSEDETFVLVGRGGTGKTTLTRKVLGLSGMPSTYIGGAALSHAAKHVLGDNIGDIKVHTIAALLGITLNETTGNFEPNQFLRNRGLPIKDYDLLIIDETSMISQKILNEIMKMKRPGTKVIFMGDNVQLPPIGEGDIESPSFRAFKKQNFAKLTERVRQGEENPIVKITDIIASNIEADDTVTRVLAMEDRKTSFDEETNRGVIFVKDEQDTIEQLTADIREGGSDPLYAKAIVFNNERYLKSSQSVYHLNKKIRSLLYGDDDKVQFNTGEILVAYDTFVRPGRAGGILLENSEALTVISQSEPYEKRVKAHHYKYGDLDETYWAIDLTVDNARGWRKTVPVVASKSLKQFNDDLRTKARGALYYRLREAFANIHYGYAITSHKAQGSTYKNVYVFEDNILGPTNAGSNRTKNKSFYVAVSRPSHKLVIHSQKNLDPDGSYPELVFSLPTEATANFEGDIPNFLKDSNPEQRKAFHRMRKEKRIFTECK